MKTILSLIAVASLGAASFGQELRPTPTTNSIASNVTNSDVIAIVAMGKVVRVPATNATGAMISLRATEAKLERVIKGNPPAKFQIRESEKPGASFVVEEAEQFDSGFTHTVTRRWLVFLKKVGDSYEPVGARGLSSISGSGLGSRVDLDMACLSLEEAEETIRKFLVKK
jgi:hypothetical protein